MINKINKVREVEVEILDVVQEICEKYNLKYSLAFGTLLGAVRHGGFIPWDDDIDIIMPREDYKKLCEIWSEVAPKNYVMQNYNTNNDTFNNFAKIRKNHTTFLQFDIEKERSYHKGIFIDIFPADRVPKGIIAKHIQYFACAVNLLYSRGYGSGMKGVVGIVEKILLSLKEENQFKLRDLAEKVICKWNNQEKCEFLVASNIRMCKVYYPSDIFENMIELFFEGKKYSSLRETDKVLKSIYGNYKELPPKEKQVWIHHPLIIDFEHNYEELEPK